MTDISEPTATYHSGQVDCMYRFTGRAYDTAMGNYFYRARYYNQSLGRFFSRDPIFSLQSLYAYRNNSPTNFTDPTGLEKTEEQREKEEPKLSPDPPPGGPPGDGTTQTWEEYLNIDGETKLWTITATLMSTAPLGKSSSTSGGSGGGGGGGGFGIGSSGSANNGPSRFEFDIPVDDPTMLYVLNNIRPFTQRDWNELTNHGYSGGYRDAARKEYERLEKVYQIDSISAGITTIYFWWMVIPTCYFQGVAWSAGKCADAFRVKGAAVGSVEFP